MHGGLQRVLSPQLSDGKSSSLKTGPCAFPNLAFTFHPLTGGCTSAPGAVTLQASGPAQAVGHSLGRSANLPTQNEKSCISVLL